MVWNSIPCLRAALMPFWRAQLAKNMYPVHPGWLWGRRQGGCWLLLAAVAALVQPRPAG